MREILFRGKRLDDGEWVHGFLTVADSETPNQFVIDYLIPRMSCYGQTEVDPETVGQFTGLLDKNGKKIFEGDIVRITDDEGNTDFSDGGIGDVGFYDGLWYVSGEVNNGLNDLTKVYYVEVIGNIHDNPELMRAQS